MRHPPPPLLMAALPQMPCLFTLTLLGAIGADAAKEEVREVVRMLKEPSTYSAAGARLPAAAP